MNSFPAQHRHFDFSLMGLAGVVGCDGENGPTPGGSGKPGHRRGHTQRITRGGGGFSAEKLGAITGAHPNFHHHFDVLPAKLHRVGGHVAKVPFGSAVLDVENPNREAVCIGQIFLAAEQADD